MKAAEVMMLAFIKTLERPELIKTAKDELRIKNGGRSEGFSGRQGPFPGRQCLSRTGRPTAESEGAGSYGKIGAFTETATSSFTFNSDSGLSAYSSTIPDD